MVMAGILNWRPGRRKVEEQPEDVNLPPTKRISTPAGDRLFNVLENGSASGTPESTASKNGVLSTIQSSSSERPSERAGQLMYSSHIWSDNEKDRLNSMLHSHQQDKKKKRWSWKLITVIVVLLLIVTVGAVLGGVLGTRKKHSNSGKDADSNSGPGKGSGSSSGSNSGSSGTATSSSGTSSATSTASNLPSGFPAGSYSMVTFLDTVQTNCTENTDTFTCYPYHTYYESSSQSQMVFKWKISGSSDSYTISSVDSTHSPSFSNEDLSLINSGEDSERYKFQLTTDIAISPSSQISSDVSTSNTICFFNSTTFDAYLYTKMDRTYPDSDTDAADDAWPFAVRIEEVVGGGQNVPNCYNTQTWEQLEDGLDAQDPANLCSCLWRNYNTPDPYT